MSLFEGTAAFYQQFRSGVPATVAAVLSRAAPHRRPRRLLDVGTGTGFVIEALKDQFSDVIGIDVDPDLLQVGRDTITPTDGQRLQLVQARAEDYKPPEGWRADLVTICRTFTGSTGRGSSPAWTDTSQQTASSQSLETTASGRPTRPGREKSRRS